MTSKLAESNVIAVRDLRTYAGKCSHLAGIVLA